MKVERCALERDHGECVGDGFVYYGKEAINGVNPAPFDALLRDKYIKKAVHGSIACSNIGMGGDPAPGHAKQCFFEDKVAAPKVKKCADEGSDCLCNGNIFYTSSLDDDKKPITKFMEVFD